jgi:hypothetical protein
MLKLIGSQDSGCPISFTKKAETDQELSRRAEIQGRRGFLPGLARPDLTIRPSKVAGP